MKSTCLMSSSQSFVVARVGKQYWWQNQKWIRNRFTIHIFQKRMQPSVQRGSYSEKFCRNSPEVQFLIVEYQCSTIPASYDPSLDPHLKFPTGKIFGSLSFSVKQKEQREIFIVLGYQSRTIRSSTGRNFVYKADRRVYLVPRELERPWD